MVKIFEEMYNSLDTIYRRVTDGRTDILRRHRPRYAYASRGKNCRSSNLKKFDVTPTDRQTDRQTDSDQYYNKLSCRRETARRFVSLNILLSLKVIRNDTVE